MSSITDLQITWTAIGLLAFAIVVIALLWYAKRTDRIIDSQAKAADREIEGRMG